MIEAEELVLQRMREGRPLMRMFVPSGTCWFLLGVGRVDNATAECVIQHEDVAPSQDGLLREHSQTYRVRNVR
jgi:hypothetical protein